MTPVDNELAALAKILPPDGLAVATAVMTRRSIRGFLPTPVARETVGAILNIAARAPSGSNIQPWKVYAIAGELKQRMTTALLDAHYHHQEDHKREYNYYPVNWRDPYLARRRACGWGLYGTLGITKGDAQRMSRQHARNYEFFGAPVGLFFTLDRDMEIGSWLDLGMFIQSVMIAASGFGLATCPQAAFAVYPKIVCPMLGIPDSEQLVCGLSLGHLDPDEPANRFWTEREDAAAFTTYIGL